MKSACGKDLQADFVFMNSDSLTYAVYPCASFCSCS